MGKRQHRERLILAIYPTSRGFGFVVFEGRHRPIDLGTKDARADKNQIVLAKAGELMSWFRPDMLILEDANAAGSRRADRIRHLHQQLVALAKSRDISVREFARSDVKAAFASRDASSKYEIAQAIAREVPDLAPWLPPPRKIWESEDPRLCIFDAASLALTFYDTEENRRAA